jgi:hypothetical protein
MISPTTALFSLDPEVSEGVVVGEAFADDVGMLWRLPVVETEAGVAVAE